MVCDSLVTQSTKAMFLWFLIVSVFAAAMPTTLWAQQSDFADFESPIIEHTPFDGGFIGGVEVFGATVVDNDEIEKVSLFYRFSGENEYAELTMREIASSSFYSVKVDTANVPGDTSAIEYYLQAQDVSGNVVLKGFAFQPLIRTFNIAEPALVTGPSPEQAEEPVPAITESKKINWLYVALGVLVVGGVAAALGSDDGEPEDDCIGGCDVTVTFGSPL